MTDPNTYIEPAWLSALRPWIWVSAQRSLFDKGEGDKLLEVLDAVAQRMVEVEAQRDKLRAFARDVIHNGDSFDWASDLCGGDIQELATKHGLLAEVPYEPEGKHAGQHFEAADVLEPGDSIFEVTPLLSGEESESND